MSAVRVGFGAAALAALLWGIGALPPSHPRYWTSLDLRWYFFPVYEAFYGALRSGEPMLWNAYQLCGMPWLGTLQGGFFYPPHVLYLLLPTPSALALSTVLHLALAAGGTAAFAHRAGLSAAGATLAAAVLAFAGPMRDWQLWPYFLESCAWLPIGALAILDLTGDRPGRGTVVLALASGLSWLAGCPQGTVLAGYAWAGLLGARLLVDRPRTIGRALGGFAVGLVTGVLLGAVALLPGFELAHHGVRRTSTLPVDFMYPFGVPPPARVFTNWFTTGSAALLATALALAPLALFARGRSLTLWALVVGGLAAVMALGPATRVFELYLALPMLGWFRVPHRLLLLAQLGLGVLAGLGLDVVASRLRWRHVAAASAVVVLAAATGQGLRTPPPVPPLPYRAEHVPWSAEHRAAYARLAETIDGARVWPFSPGFMQYALPPKLPTLAGLRSVEDYEPLTLRRQYEYFVFFSEGGTRYSNIRAPFIGRITTLASPEGRPPPATRRRLLDLAAVRYLLMPSQTRTRPDVRAFIRDARLEDRPPLVPAIEMVENPHVLPRAFVTYRARSAPPAEELLPLLATESFDPLAESRVEGDAGLPPPASAPARGAAATIVRDDPQVVEVDATLAAPGLVVLADTYYAGWTATVDGAPALLFATNHLFRGVPAPAGTHRIRFEYRPRMLWTGATLSLLAALGLAVAARRLKTRPTA